ncbi:MAG: conjugal transfer protein TraC, partial [Candidatus Methylumidiphilus sp.]
MNGAEVYKKQIERHSISDLMPHLAYDRETSLYVLSDGYVGFGFVSRPLSGTDDTVTQRLNVFLTFDYPEGSFIQIMLLASQDIRERMDAMMGVRDSGISKSLKKSAENRVSLFVDATRKPISHNLPAFVRDFKVVISIKIPHGSKEGMPSEKDMALASELRLKSGESLKSAGLGVYSLDPETLLRTIGTLLHWGPNANWRQAHRMYDDSLPINEQIPESDDMIEVDVQGVWLGHKRLRILSPGRLPATMDIWNMRKMIGDPLNGTRGMHGNFFINLNLYIPDNAAERSSLETKRNTINYQAFGPMPKFVPKILFKKESADTLSA